ncbi:beta-1,6-N-acetylglucosaminyltransferase [Mangrovibacterium lignilyticum]|uniref:beta-1,6-N-acetylglucosaminyltransferase n=1 Tax=Mangrovibacterium lignilyticum TaxID=2668052 RepID=UPI0013D0FC2F|nr:beta-1,6-N-acetylglucosaminyltransferase [Mangrovibacterium lignilyticum]
MEKIAYLILAHNDAPHLARLIKKLNLQADFYIHIDKKTDTKPFEQLVKSSSNIYYVSETKRVDVQWGGISQIDATLSLIEEFLNQQKKVVYTYKKIVLLSGACYPIKSNEYIHSFFENNRSTNFIRATNTTTANSNKYNRAVCKYWFFNIYINNRQLKKISRAILEFLYSPFQKKNYFYNKAKKFDIYHGSQWWALNYDVIKYFYSSSFQNKMARKYFKYSLAPDEKYFHTIFFNSPHKTTNQQKGPEKFVPHTSAYANIHVIDKSLSKYFTDKDFEVLSNSDKLFVRKVNSELSSSLLDQLDLI